MAASEPEPGRDADDAEPRPRVRPRPGIARPNDWWNADVPTTLVIDVADLRSTDIGTVGALARIAVEAHRHGHGIRIVGASNELRELLALTGLTRALGVERRRSVQPGR